MTKNTGPLVILLARWLRLPATQIALLTMVWALVALTNLGGATLWDIDEGNNAEASREMRAADNWVVPTFNYQLRVDKPALINWLQILCGMVFGEGEFAARFPSALAGLATVLAVWLLGRLCLGGLGGLLSAFVLLGCPLFVAAMRFANPDSLLTALVSWCLVCFFLGQRGAGVWWLYGAACASGLAMLAKGPVGLAMPGAIILVHLLLAGGWLRIPWRHLAGAFLVWLAVAGPWYLWVGVETKFAWHKGFFLQHNLGRLAAPMEGHGGPVWYYLPILLAGTFPFSTLLLLPALVLARRRTLPDWWPLLALGCAWVAVPVVVFSLSRTKLPNYVLPAYPGLALLLAAGMTGWRRGLITAPMGWVRLGMGILAVAGVAVAAGFLVGGGAIAMPFSDKVKPLAGLESMAPVGSRFLVAGLAGWVLAHRALPTVAIVTVCGLLFSMVLGAWNGQTLNAHKAPKALATALPADQMHREVRLGVFEWFQPSFVYYTRRAVERIPGETDLEWFLTQPIAAYVAMPAERWEGLRGRFPNARELLRQPDFYRRCEVVLVANAAAGQ